ncbi:LysR family transcriptional regulator [Paraferrimonas haliotis]|uniref:LysR family transcriptional regulator n=1 Tax=Paraferrimonas haliotis TaxID=2013866 RepID=A0AA37TMJ5_9GAMM|nr:LysR family transcriptional regulator [Paraferrimonas haliotis]GLS82433.1 LysR family transcriptional regulator [Paraferrimonas haliotis]
MKTADIKTFIKTVELGSISQAAKALFITQSAASQRLKALEERIGKPLLDRSSSRIVATHAGKVLLDYGSRIIALEDAMLQQIKPNTQRKHFSLCCTPTFGQVYLPNIVQALTERFDKEVELDFVFDQTANAVNGLNQGTYDAIIVEHLEPLDKQTHVFECLPPDQLIFVASADYPISNNAGELDMKGLLSNRLFTRKPGCSSRALLLQNLKQHGCDLSQFESVIVSDDLRMTLTRITSGHGIALLSTALVRSLLSSGELRGYTIPTFDLMRRRSLLIQRNQSEQALIRAFIDEVHKAFKL